MEMYRRDTRFEGVEGVYNRKLELNRTILDMLHAPMRMHEKVLNLLYAELLKSKILAARRCTYLLWEC
jgi:hypothetical protein